jgi:hypothetical protein
MATELANVPSELLLGSTETLERALQRPPTQALSPRDAKDLLRHSRYVLTRITEIYDRSRKEMTSGVEGSEFGQMCDHMTVAIERYQALSHTLEKMIQQQRPSVRQRRRLAYLKVMEEKTTRILQAYQAWSVLCHRPPRQIDWAAVAEAEAAHARGDHRPATEFEADMKMRYGL